MQEILEVYWSKLTLAIVVDAGSRPHRLDIDSGTACLELAGCGNVDLIELSRLCRWIQWQCLEPTGRSKCIPSTTLTVWTYNLPTARTDVRRSVARRIIVRALAVCISADREY